MRDGNTPINQTIEQPLFPQFIDWLIDWLTKWLGFKLEYTFGARKRFKGFANE